MRALWSEKTDASGKFLVDDRLVFFPNDIDFEFLAYDENSKCNEGLPAISSDYSSGSGSSLGRVSRKIMPNLIII
jgi:hypothetical protein